MRVCVFVFGPEEPSFTPTTTRTRPLSLSLSACGGLTSHFYPPYTLEAVSLAASRAPLQPHKNDRDAIRPNLHPQSRNLVQRVNEFIIIIIMLFFRGRNSKNRRGGILELSSFFCSELKKNKNMLGTKRVYITNSTGTRYFINLIGLSALWWMLIEFRGEFREAYFIFGRPKQKS